MSEKMRETIFVDWASVPASMEFNKSMRIVSVGWCVSADPLANSRVRIDFGGANTALSGATFDKKLTIYIDAQTGQGSTNSGSIPIDVVTNQVNFSWTSSSADGTLVFLVEWI